MADSIDQVILDVQSVCPDADPNLARLWVRDAARRTMEARQWSWLLKRGQFIVPAPVTAVSTGETVTVDQGNDVVTFTGAVATEDMVGWQFRTSTNGPIYDVTGYIANDTLRISPPWGGTDASGQTFTLAKFRLPLPADCVEMVSCTSTIDRWRLWINVPQETLDSNDPSRNRTNGIPSLLSPCDYSTLYAGTVDAALRVVGTNDRPVSGGAYTGQDDAVYTLAVTTGGVGGVAVFQWKKNEDTYTTGVTSDSTFGNELSDGVTALWPLTSTFSTGDLFVITTHARSSPGVARVELYPSSSSPRALSFLYYARYPDLTDPDVQIPGMLSQRTDIIREKALEFAASWPGTEDRPNPYTQINRRDYHASAWLALTLELARQDNALFQRNVLPKQRLPYAPWPFAGYGNMQEYDYWDYPPENWRML